VHSVIAVRYAVPVVENSKEMECIQQGFAQVFKEVYDATRRFILDLIVSDLESFGGLYRRAGAALEEVVVRGIADSTQFSSMDL
jgi:hypothetical protein